METMKHIAFADAGNTSLKIAIHSGIEWISYNRHYYDDLAELRKDLLDKKVTKIVCSSVVSKEHEKKIESLNEASLMQGSLGKQNWQSQHCMGQNCVTSLIP